VKGFPVLVLYRIGYLTFLNGKITNEIIGPVGNAAGFVVTNSTVKAGVGVIHVLRTLFSRFAFHQVTPGKSCHHYQKGQTDFHIYKSCKAPAK
jgi:hypothetical protein